METELIWLKAVEAVNEGNSSFFKFISANDSGETGAHQAGFLIPKQAIPVFLKSERSRGENYCEDILIEWQDGFITNSLIRYYGQSTRNEYRVTSYGRAFQYKERIQTGDLLVMVRVVFGFFKAFILKTEEEINSFLDTFGLSPVDSGIIIDRSYTAKPVSREEVEFGNFFKSLANEFPSTSDMSNAARNIDLRINNKEYEILDNPDKKIIDWIEYEYRLFRFIEKEFFQELVKPGFPNLEDFLKLANSVLNRRKSRAGKSLEHHLSFLFNQNKLTFTEQGITKGKSRPDFIFPGLEEYHNNSFPRDRIVVLAAKTTCKDRWRQILNETENLNRHYLFTLQQGITSNQLDEMIAANVQLVVPQSYVTCYPGEYRNKLLTLKQFINNVGVLASNK